MTVDPADRLAMIREVVAHEGGRLPKVDNQGRPLAPPPVEVVVPDPEPAPAPIPRVPTGPRHSVSADTGPKTVAEVIAANTARLRQLHDQAQGIT